MSVAIRNKRSEIEEELDSLQKELERLQRRCKHKNVTKTYRCSTRNYDPTADCYWIEYTCPDCGKHWSEAQ